MLMAKLDRLRTMEDLRALLDQRLRGGCSDRLWVKLVDENWISDVLADEMTVDELVETVESWRSVLVPPVEGEDPPAGPPAPSPRLVPEMPGQPDSRPERQRALSDLLAAFAADDPDVAAYRARVLPGGLVPWDQLADWVRRQEGQDGPPTRWVTVPLPIRTELDRLGPGHYVFKPALGEVHAGIGTKIRLLKWAAPGDTWPRHTPTTIGKPLEALRSLAEALAPAYGWTEVQAAVFIVTGVTPLVTPVRVTFGGHRVRNQIECAWAERITLTIDPAVGPDEVAELHREARTRLGFAHLRPQTAKHLRLAAFTGAETERLAWAERLRFWNERYPADSYEHASNFRRDAIRAQARLLYPGQFRGQAPVRGQLASSFPEAGSSQRSPHGASL